MYAAPTMQVASYNIYISDSISNYFILKPFAFIQAVEFFSLWLEQLSVCCILFWLQKIHFTWLCWEWKHNWRKKKQSKSRKKLNVYNQMFCHTLTYKTGAWKCSTSSSLSSLYIYSFLLLLVVNGKLYGGRCCYTVPRIFLNISSE